MKKLLVFFVAAGMTFLTGCEGPEGPQGQDGYNVEAEVFELLNVDFDFSGNEYSIYRELNPNILDSDTVLIYRLSGTIDSQTPIWQLIPRTLYINEFDELDYDYDFSPVDFTIYAGGNYDLSTTPSYLQNQTFRIVIIPGYFSNKSANKVDKENYNAVIEAYGLEGKPVKQI